MFNRKKVSAILKITMASLLFTATLAHPEERSLADAGAAALHEGPDSQSRVIKTVPNDQSFEVLETLHDFIRIRTKDGTEGWVQDSFTATKPAELTPAKHSDDKGDVLTQKPREKTTSNSGRAAVKTSDAPLDSQPKKESFEQPSAKESTEIKKLQAELSELTKQFNQAEAAAAGAQQLKIENETLKAESSALHRTIAELQQANISLDNKKNFYWFFAGGTVFFLGWLIGRTSLRRQRHSSLTL